LSAAGAAQDEVIAVVERLVVELSDKADFGRIVRELSQLRSDQIAHEESAHDEIGLATLPLGLDELTREQRAALDKAAGGQEAIARRFEKLEQAIDRLAVELDLIDAPASNTLKDAAALGRRLAIAAHMHDSARDLAENRVGRARELETRIAADLEQVLDVLRKRGPERDKELEQKLDDIRQAEQDLAALRRQVARLREEAARAAAPAERAQQGQRQEELRREADRLARQLEQLGAKNAAQSTRAAADRLNEQRPGDEQLQQADEKLDEAARQLAERRAQEELNLALALMNRFRGELEEMIRRQQAVVNDTEKVEKARRAAETLSDADVRKLDQLAAEERALAGLAVEHRDVLKGLGSVRISLEEAERRLVAAGELLTKRDSGPEVQQAERRALARLQGMLDAIAQTVAEAEPKPENQNAQGQPPPGQPPQRRPAFELLEVKMLRMMQVELNERTAEHGQRAADPDRRLSDADRAALDRDAQDLAAEQRRLAELVEEMLSRNNGGRAGEQ
jgi:hypothetical protein